MSAVPSNKIKMPAAWAAYDVQAAGDEFVVVERRSGRPMSDLLSSLDAGILRDTLNAAYFGGRSSLHRALGAE